MMRKSLLTIPLVVSCVVAGANAQSTSSLLQSSTLNQGLVACYQFNGNTADSSGNGNDGTPVNVSYTTDRNGFANSAVRLNGSNGYIKYPDSLMGPTTTGFTWSIWTLPDAGVGELYTNNEWWVMDHGAVQGEAMLGYGNMTAYGKTGYRFGVHLAQSLWHFIDTPSGMGLTHIICVYQRGSRLEIWINGQLSASMIPPDENLWVLNGYPNYSGIGTYQNIDGATNCFKGVIDDVRIYNRALSSAEVQQLFVLDQTPLATGTAAIVKQQDSASGIEGGKFFSIGVPALNNALHTAFQATVTGTDTASTKAIGHNDSGIWADDGIGIRQFVVRTGTVAPGTNGAVFSALSDPVYNDNNVVAFMGTLKPNIGDVVTHRTKLNPVNNSIGIWSNDNGALHLVARQGQQAPGMDAGVFFSSFLHFALPNQGGASNAGGVVLLAGVGGKGVLSKSTKGIWAVDTTGNLKLILCEGGAFDDKTVKDISFLSSGATEAGQTRNFAQSTGDILFKATFTDDSWGVYKVVFP